MDWLLPPGNTLGLPGAVTIGTLMLKALFVLGFALYAVFAFVVIRQVRMMGQTYKTALGPVLTIFAVAHFLIAMLVLIFAILVL